MNPDQIKQILKESDKIKFESLFFQINDKDPWNAFYSEAKLKDLLQFKYYESILILPEKKKILREAINELFNRLEELYNKLSNEVNLYDLIELLEMENDYDFEFYTSFIERSLEPYPEIHKVTILELIKFKLSYDKSTYRKKNRDKWESKDPERDENFQSSESNLDPETYMRPAECFYGSPFRIRCFDEILFWPGNSPQTLRDQEPQTTNKLTWVKDSTTFYRVLYSLIKTGCFGDIGKSKGKGKTSEKFIIDKMNQIIQPTKTKYFYPTGYSNCNLSINDKEINEIIEMLRNPETEK